MSELSFEEILNKITQSPEIMAKISEISNGKTDSDLSEKLPLAIDVISPLLNIPQDKESSGEKTEKTDTSAAKSENVSSAPLPFSLDKLSAKISKSSPLLLALKPYLSKERSDIVESIVRVAQITDIMKLTR